MSRQGFVHSPYVGRDTAIIILDRLVMVFQSTLPLQGETIVSILPRRAIIISIHTPNVGSDLDLSNTFLRPHASIHSSHAGRDQVGARAAAADQISIHSSYAGRDDIAAKRFMAGYKFQSTLPMQGETPPNE